MSNRFYPGIVFVAKLLSLVGLLWLNSTPLPVGAESVARSAGQTDNTGSEIAWYTLPLLFTHDLDAAVNWGNGKLYLFKGSQYLRFSLVENKVDAGYPKEITVDEAGTWPGLWPEGVEAALNWGDGKVYFFKGSDYIRYDIKTGRADPGYPQPIAGNWPGLWPEGVDAAVNLGNGRALFFKGNEYLSFDIAANDVEPGYPKPLAQLAPGSWPATGRAVDAVISANNQLYFFSGGQYWLYDLAARRVEVDYPRQLGGEAGGSWSGVWPAGVAAALNWEGEKAYLFNGSEYISYDITAGQLDYGYPRPVTGEAGETGPGLWPEGVETGVNWGDGTAYFFRGKEYIHYDLKTNQVQAGYPQEITVDEAGSWPGLWPEGVEAALNWGNGKVYFFKGGEYIRYDIKTGRADSGYPQPIAGNWPGLWPEGIDAAVNLGNGRALFFKGDEYLSFDIAANDVEPGYPRPVAQLPRAIPAQANELLSLPVFEPAEWVGHYFFSSQAGVDYFIRVYEEDGVLLADLEVDDPAAPKRLKAVAIPKANLLFFFLAGYPPENKIEQYAVGDFLLALEASGGKLLTYWGALAPASAATGTAEVQFEPEQPGASVISLPETPILTQGVAYLRLGGDQLDVDGNGLPDFQTDTYGVNVRGVAEFGLENEEKVTLASCQNKQYYDDLPHDPNSNKSSCFQTDQGYTGKFQVIERDASGGLYLKFTVWGEASPTAVTPSGPPPYEVALGSPRYENWGSPANPNGCGGPYNDLKPVRNFRIDLFLTNHSDQLIPTGWRPYFESARGHALPSCYWTYEDRQVGPGQTIKVVWGTFTPTGDWVTALYLNEHGYPLRLCLNQAGAQIPCP